MANSYLQNKLFRNLNVIFRIAILIVLLLSLFSIGSFCLPNKSLSFMHNRFFFFNLSESTFFSGATLHAVRLLHNEATEPAVYSSNRSSSCKYREPPVFLRAIALRILAERAVLKSSYSKGNLQPLWYFKMRTAKEAMFCSMGRIYPMGRIYLMGISVFS